MRIHAIESVPFYVLPHLLAPSMHAARGEVLFFRAYIDELPDALDAIIATADLQGVVDVGGTFVGLGDALPQLIERFRDDGRLPARQRTAAILAGDLHARAGEDDVLPVWRAMGAVCRWVAGVAGNHDRLGPDGSDFSERDILAATNAHILDGSTVTLDGIRVAGLGGIVGSVDGPRLRREDAYNTALSELVSTDCDLLVLHDGPNIAGTNLTGWPSIRRVLEAAPPMLAIRGHDHWDKPMAELTNTTQVLNVEGRVIVLVRRQ